MAKLGMSREEFERRRNEGLERLREFEEYVARRTAELEERQRAREEAEGRRAGRRRFLPFR